MHRYFPLLPSPSCLQFHHRARSRAARPSRERNSSASPGPVDAATTFPTDLKPVAIAIGSEYDDVVMQEAAAGPQCSEKAAPELRMVEGGGAALSQSEAARDESITEGIEQSQVPCGAECADDQGVVLQGGTGQAASVTEQELGKRLERLAIGGSGEPTISGHRVDGLMASNALLERIVDLVHHLFDQRKNEVRWVTPTAQLDRYEAIAYLIADLLNLELLLDEARPIGC